MSLERWVYTSGTEFTVEEGEYHREDKTSEEGMKRVSSFLEIILPPLHRKVMHSL
jgi:hypothetical protein